MDISPMTWILPDEAAEFEQSREDESDPNMLYILKPSAASCGRGIRVIGKKTPVNKKDGLIACKYIMNPHIFNGYKYDLRVYVLVSSYEPLKVYVYNEGLVRFATEPYTNNPKDLKKKFVHLTNFSVNKKSENFVVNKGNDEEGGGQNSSKWSFKELRAAFEEQDINYDYIFAQIKDVIVKTLICVEPAIVSTMDKCPGNRNSCFELYGFDILID
jgi:tubulin polyglutamylase TTLL4